MFFFSFFNFLFQFFSTENIRNQNDEISSSYTHSISSMLIIVFVAVVVVCCCLLLLLLLLMMLFFFLLFCY